MLQNDCVGIPSVLRSDPNKSEFRSLRQDVIINTYKEYVLGLHNDLISDGLGGPWPLLELYRCLFGFTRPSKRPPRSKSLTL